jgi:hypothetical protein
MTIISTVVKPLTSESVKLAVDGNVKIIKKLLDNGTKV